MSKEVKFRAWDKDKKKMHYGVETWDELPLIINLQGKYADWILMQYTGLKDKNGKEIYEGDIMKVLIGGYEEIGIVVFDEEKLIFAWRHPKDNIIYELYLLKHFEPFEVIGNIYENPELLKEMKP